MNQEDVALLLSLLKDCRVLSLGVLIEGEPYVGLMPFALSNDFGSLIIHASKLARHTRGLMERALYGVLIHRPDDGTLNPLEIPRVSLQGLVHIVAPGSSEHESSQQTYIQKFPQGEPMFGFGDFQLYQLELVSGRLVAGFGHTINLNRDHFRELRGNK